MKQNGEGKGVEDFVGDENAERRRVFWRRGQNLEFLVRDFFEASALGFERLDDAIAGRLCK